MLYRVLCTLHMLLLRPNRRTEEMNAEEKTTNHSRRMCQLQQYIVSSEKSTHNRRANVWQKQRA